MQDIDHIQSFTDTMAKFTAYFGKHLPDDVVEKLTELRKEQTSEISKIIYDAMFVVHHLLNKNGDVVDRVKNIERVS